MLDFFGIVFFLFFGFVSVLFFSSFVSKRHHLLMTLLSLEGLLLSLFGSLCLFGSFLNFYPFLLVYLTFIACEGALGLSLLVLIVRSWGSDHFNSFNSFKC